MSKGSKRDNYSRREGVRRRLRAIGAPCAICGAPIDYSLDWVTDPRTGKRKRHPMSFEADHIDTLANGGGNEFENFQATHRICNLRKGAGRRVMPQSVDIPLDHSRRW